LPSLLAVNTQGYASKCRQGGCPNHPWLTNRPSGAKKFDSCHAFLFFVLMRYLDSGQGPEIPPAAAITGGPLAQSRGWSSSVEACSWREQISPPPKSSSACGGCIRRRGLGCLANRFI